MAPSSLGKGISGLFTIGFIKKGEYVIDYTGKIKGSEHFKFEFLISKVNEICDRQYSFELDEKVGVDSVDVGNLMRFANNGHEILQSENFGL